MAEIVYILCGVTSIGCAVLLFLGYRNSRKGLLFWSSLCFAGLAVNNILLYIDLVITGPYASIPLWRSGVALVAVMTLLVGLIWESR